MTGVDHNILYPEPIATLDVVGLQAKLAAHPDLLDYDPDAEQSNIVDISQYEDKTLKNAVVRTRLKRLAMRGKNAVEAAACVGWSVAAVRNIYRDPDFRRDVLSALEGALEVVDEAFKEDEQSLNEQMEAFTRLAFNDLMANFDNYNANQKIKVTLDLLDRNDATNRRHTAISKDAAALTPEVLANAARAGQEMDAIREGRLARFRKTG